MDDIKLVSFILMTCILKTVSRERMGYIYQIHMGCKSADACANNKKANFDNPNPHYTQCRPEVKFL